MKELKTMDKQKQTVGNYMGTLAQDAQDLMAATSDVAGEKVDKARKRLGAAMERGKEVYGQVRDKALDGVRVTDQAVRDHPYQVLGIAFGVGALIGFLAARRRDSDSD
jgi:ElaB/YqjD/DUF883 family membrane-anchored ribosome-binding protein